MSNRRKAFKFEASDAEPFPLEINGEEVVCVADAGGLALLEYTAVMRNQYSSVGERAAAMTKWLQVCLGVDVNAGETTSEEWRKFQVIAKKNGLAIEDLGDIAAYLTDVYTERPTKSAEPSSTGQTTTGSSSADSSSSEG